jgi:hypothetical protein
MTEDVLPKPAKAGFDPAVVERDAYEKVAIWLPSFGVQFLNAGLPSIENKTFTDCLIEGPAVMLLKDEVFFDACNLGVAADPKTLLVQPVGDRATGVIPFSHCRFIRCRFVGVGYMGSPEFQADISANLAVRTGD